jgi:hypothetical protein
VVQFDTGRRQRRIQDLLLYRASALQYEWRERGFLLHTDVSYRVDTMVFVLSVSLDDFERGYSITEDELYMEGSRAIDHVLRFVERDIRDYCARTHREQSARIVNDALLRIADPPVISGPQMTATEVRERHREWTSSGADRLDSVFMSQYAAEMHRLLEQAFLRPQHTSEAEAKA